VADSPIFWRAWVNIVAEPCVVKTLKEGYKFPFLGPPLLSLGPGSPSQQPQSVAEKQGGISGSGSGILDPEGSNRDRSSEVGVLLQDFPGLKTRRSVATDYRSVESELDVYGPGFRMEMPATILRAVQLGQWLTSLDLKYAYFHIRYIQRPLLSQVLPLRQNLAVQGFAVSTQHQRCSRKCSPQSFQTSICMASGYIPGRLVAKPGYQGAI